MIAKFETHGEDTLVCPYCEIIIPDSWDFEEDNGLHRCENCGKLFTWQRNVVVTYSSHANCELNNESHAWESYEIDGETYLVCNNCGKIVNAE